MRALHVAAAIALVLVFSACEGLPLTPASTLVPSTATTPSPTNTPALVPTPTPTNSPIPTPTPTLTPTPTPPTPTYLPTPSPTLTPTLSPTPTPMPTAPPTPTPTPTPLPKGVVYASIADGGWSDLAEVLEEFPHLDLRQKTSWPFDFYLAYDGYVLNFRCYREGRGYEQWWTRAIYATQECLDDYRAKCGRNYRPEILPGRPGCLDRSGKASYGPFIVRLDHLPPLDESWFPDGLSDRDFVNLMEIGKKLLRMEGQDDDLVSRVFDLPWLQRPIASLEAKVLSPLLGTAKARPWVLEMPFLQRVDSLDNWTLISLSKLSRRENEKYLERILSAPMFSAGVTDENASLLFVLEEAIFNQPEIIFRTSEEVPTHDELVDVLLDPAQTVIEKREIQLPLAGLVRLSVIRPGVQASDISDSLTMDLLEQAIRSQEEFMGVAFPQNHAVVLSAEIYPSAGTGGHRALIVTRFPENRGVIAHEVAHTYWSYGIGWIKEGAAEFLEEISRQAYDGTPLPTSEPPCLLFDNLYDLERSDLGSNEIYRSGCPYFLGRGIFRELYERLGDGTARSGFARLYLALRDDSYARICSRDDWSACYVQTAFSEGATAEQAAIIEEIIARRYYGSP